MQASYSKISQKIDQICAKNKTKLRNVLTASTEICRYISHKTPVLPHYSSWFYTRAEKRNHFSLN